jgi:hypothetical protein
MDKLNYCGIVYDIKATKDNVKIINVRDNKETVIRDVVKYNMITDQVRALVWNINTFRNKSPKSFFEQLDDICIVFEE